ncbi:hypothetical protein N7478_001438 [Penicillium angulare]|uniref:uncharacterized protein n=1 Tax=Penicillium angulare TaxID=116970 RepID=UPI002540C9BA|nr:uncharacterized protein N7478_001438 [Penicillium angulare]KAJ5292187.1 hypothetical protein N7478_001438 [Penicillium angulare]
MAKSKKTKSKKTKSKKTKSKNGKSSDKPDARNMQTPVSPGNSPGEQASQSNDQDDVSDSGDDSEAENDDTSRPQAEEPALHEWVKKIIREKTRSESPDFIDSFFNTPWKENTLPDLNGCVQFFTNLNQLIRGANQQHPEVGIDDGTIPERTYSSQCEAYITKFQRAIEHNNQEAAWEAFYQTYDTLNFFNKRHFLPLEWNLSRRLAAERIGIPDPRPEEPMALDEADLSDSEDEENATSSPKRDESISDDRLFTQEWMKDLDGIDARAVEKQRRLNGGEVLYWWRVEVGSQIFVQYGEPPYSIYRIRAGSYQNYDKRATEQIFWSTSRGHAKARTMKDGILVEDWKWNRTNVQCILGIGFKIEDDQEHGISSKYLIKPSHAAGCYPQTRLIVLWRDGDTTLDDRSFGRRILNTRDDGIYQFVSDKENAYWERYAEDSESNASGFDSDTDNESEIGSQSESDTSSDDDADNNTDLDRPIKSGNWGRKMRMRGTRRSESKPYNRKSPGRDSSYQSKRIRALEKELESLKLSQRKKSKTHYSQGDRNKHIRPEKPRHSKSDREKHDKKYRSR